MPSVFQTANLLKPHSCGSNVYHLFQNSTEFEQPDFVVFANLDNDASDLNELQQSVGIYLQNRVNLRQLNGSLTQVVAATKSEHLPAA